MAKKIVGLSMSEAQPWVKGKIVAGVYSGSVSVTNSITKEPSLKHEFEQGNGAVVGAWGTASLDAAVRKFKVGGCYKITCMGKTIETKAGNAAWEFEILEAENAKEAKTFGEEYRAYVMNGGK